MANVGNICPLCCLFVGSVSESGGREWQHVPTAPTEWSTTPDVTRHVPATGTDGTCRVVSAATAASTLLPHIRSGAATLLLHTFAAS